MKLIDYLTMHGIKQTDFARQLKIDSESIYNYVHEKRVPSLAIALAIEKLTHGDVTPADFMIKKKKKREGLNKKEIIKALDEFKKALYLLIETETPNLTTTEMNDLIKLFISLCREEVIRLSCNRDYS